MVAGEDGRGGAIYFSGSSISSAISGCDTSGNSAAVGGGIYLDDNSIAEVASSTKLCNNTASGYAAADMNAVLATDAKPIDGWYDDAKDARYTPSIDGVPHALQNKTKGELCLVASHVKKAETAKPAKVSLTAKVELSGASLQEGQFSFSLKSKSDNSVLNAENAADGTIVFPDLSFDAEGTYEYVISQVDQGKEGYKYDSAEYPVIIKVTKNDNGDFDAEVSNDCLGSLGTPEFKVTYSSPNDNSGNKDDGDDKGDNGDNKPDNGGNKPDNGGDKPDSGDNGQNGDGKHDDGTQDPGKGDLDKNDAPDNGSSDAAVEVADKENPGLIDNEQGEPDASALPVTGDSPMAFAMAALVSFAFTGLMISKRRLQK